MIAIVTGASAGLAAQFARQIHREQFPEIDTVWLIARRVGKLEDLAQTIQGQAGHLPRPRPLRREEASNISPTIGGKKLTKVGLLVNNAGWGTLGNLGEVPNETQAGCATSTSALTLMTNMVLPYMVSGGHIINVSSIASFCPNPRMTVYSASKAYVSAFTGGLPTSCSRAAFRSRRVCPGPMQTEFLDVAGITGKTKTFQTLPYCDPEQVVAGACAAKRGRTVLYAGRAFTTSIASSAKVLPMKWMISSKDLTVLSVS